MPLKPAEYRYNAEKCRWLSTLTSDKHRKEQCLELANKWEEMAAQREINVTKTQELTEKIDNIVISG